MSMKVTSRMIVAHKDYEEGRLQWYPNPTGLVRREYRSETHESDFANGVWVRESLDNGPAAPGVNGSMITKTSLQNSVKRMR